jgi:hypothetical protein
LGPEGAEVVAHVGADERLPMLRPGDAVWASFESAAARLLPGAAADADPDAAAESPSPNPS